LNGAAAWGAAWIIEIVSPGSLVLDTCTKFNLYAENGVAEYWIAFSGG